MNKMDNQNQESGSGQQTINIQVPSLNNIASRRSLIPVLFAAVIIFFFFNFFTVSCGGQKVGSVTGINLVTGTELKGRDMFSGGETKGEKIPSSVWAIIAFGAAIIGLGTFLIKEKREALIGTGAGAIGFGSLLILQFAITNAVEKKTEGAIQADFQFAYWGSLMAMGIAGFISYLRIQKTHRIVVNIVPPLSPKITIPDNVSQPTLSDNPIHKTINSGIVKWFNTRKVVAIGTVVLVVILLGVYYFLLKHDPAKEGKDIAISFCNCGKDQRNEKLKIYKDFISNYGSYKLNGRDSAISLLKSKIKIVDEKFPKCIIETSSDYTKLRSQFITDKEKLDKFDFAFTAQQKLCNHNTYQTEFDEIYAQVQKIINQPLN